MYIPNEVNALIAAAQDARHCLSAVTDATLASSIERSISAIEESIANVQKFYQPVEGDYSWMNSYMMPVAPTKISGSSKDSFMDERERSHNAWRRTHGFENA